MDDCHACIDAIEDGMTITLPRAHQVYQPLLALFSTDLKDQGTGTHAEIEQGDYDALLPVPYWAWMDHHDAVAGILAKHAKTDRRKIRVATPQRRPGIALHVFPFPVPGIEITPTSVRRWTALRLPTLYRPRTVRLHRPRRHHSTTLFLVKGLGLAPATDPRPARRQERKMVRRENDRRFLSPDQRGTRPRHAHQRSLPTTVKRRFGVVAITPSFKRAKNWQDAGAISATSKTIYAEIEKLKQGHCEQTLAIANRYDGIDLPDNSRAASLILDNPSHRGKHSRTVGSESCRAGSEITLTRIRTTIEQGLGRSVQGGKRLQRDHHHRTRPRQATALQENQDYFSAQTQTQIRIGLDIAEFAKEDIAAGKQPVSVLNDLINQCLKRDAGWKNFYEQQMNSAPKHSNAAKSTGDLRWPNKLQKQAFQSGKPETAMTALQALMDEAKNHRHGKRLVPAGNGAVCTRIRQDPGPMTCRSQRTNLIGISLKRRAPAWSSANRCNGHKSASDASWHGSSSSPILTNSSWTLRLSRRNCALASRPTSSKARLTTSEPRWASSRNARQRMARRAQTTWHCGENHYSLIEFKNQVDEQRKEINKAETRQIKWGSCAGSQTTIPVRHTPTS